ncbi:hypothetical protein FDECE_13666 [Fusarium decemcellulare]|nr:hypothetical protein FDECE_13666 [Fusarium decemcellulare]
MEDISTAFSSEPPKYQTPESATKRVQPFILPQDEEWAFMLAEFDGLLKSDLTLQEIVSDYFTRQEVELLIASDRPQTKELQKKNTKEYNALLAGRFKGVDRDLASKLTMLYFGLPIEPLISPLDELAELMGDDMTDPAHYTVQPPLQFLTAHYRRGLGKDSRRDKEEANFPIPVPTNDPTQPVLGLRGGDADDEPEDFREDLMTNPDYCPSSETPALPQDEWIYLYGYNGCIPIVPRKWHSYSRALRQLLHLELTHDPFGTLKYTLTCFNRQTKKWENIDDQLPLKKDSPAMKCLRDHFADVTTSKHANCCAFFVKPKSELPQPLHWEPLKDQFNMDLVKIGRHVYAVDDGPGKDAISYAYLPFPKTKETSFVIDGFGSNQFNDHLKAAIEILYGKPSYTSHLHALFRLQDINHPDRVCEIPEIYGAMGQMQWVWEMLNPINNPDACWMVDSTRLESDTAALIFPGYYPQPRPYLLSQSTKNGTLPFTKAFDAIQSMVTEAFDADTLSKLDEILVIRGDTQHLYLYGGDIQAFQIPANRPFRLEQRAKLGEKLSQLNMTEQANYFWIFPQWKEEESRIFPSWSHRQQNCWASMTPLSGGLEDLQYQIARICKTTDYKKLYHDCILLKALPPWDSLEVPNTDSPAYLITPSTTENEWFNIRLAITACDVSLSLHKKADIDWKTCIPKSNHWGVRVTVFDPDDIHDDVTEEGFNRKRLRRDIMAPEQIFAKRETNWPRHLVSAASDASTNLPFIKKSKKKVDGRLGTVTTTRPEGRQLSQVPPNTQFTFTGWPPSTLQPASSSSVLQFPQTPTLHGSSTQQSDLEKAFEAFEKSQRSMQPRVEEVAEDVPMMEASREEAAETDRVPEQSTQASGQDDAGIKNPELMEVDEESSEEEEESDDASVRSDASIHSLPPGPYTPLPPKLTERFNWDDRTRTWTRQPGIYENWDPKTYPSCEGINIPITAPPAEKMLRTTNNLPMMTKGMLTPTEQADLQQAFWSVRNIALKRVMECQFKDCRFTYRLDQKDVIEKHIKTAHEARKCMWCDEPLFEWWDQEQKNEHLRTQHKAELVKALGLKSVSKPKPAPKQQPAAGVFARAPVPTAQVPPQSAAQQSVWDRPQPRSQVPRAPVANMTGERFSRNPPPTPVVYTPWGIPIDKSRGRPPQRQSQPAPSWNPTQLQPQPQPPNDGLLPFQRIAASMNPNPVGPEGIKRILDDMWQTRRSQPPRLLMYPLPWHDQPGPRPSLDDPPKKCPISDCYENNIDYLDSRGVWEHFKHFHPEQEMNFCPFCGLSFVFSNGLDANKKKVWNRRPEVECIKHFDCHVYKLWDILEPRKTAPWNSIPQMPPLPDHRPLRAYLEAADRAASEQEEDGAGNIGQRMLSKVYGTPRPDKKCAYVEKCGVNVADMSEKQYRRHLRDTHRDEIEIPDSGEEEGQQEKEVEEEAEEEVPRPPTHRPSSAPRPRRRSTPQPLPNPEILPSRSTARPATPASVMPTTETAEESQVHNEDPEDFEMLEILEAQISESNEPSVSAKDTLKEKPKKASRVRRRSTPGQLRPSSSQGPGSEDELSAAPSDVPSSRGRRLPPLKPIQLKPLSEDTTTYTPASESRSTGTQGRSQTPKKKQTKGKRPAKDNDGEYEDDGAETDDYDEIEEGEGGVMRRRRGRSPDWVKRLGPSDPDFDPDDDMYCSKCLRKVPKRRGRSPLRSPIGREKEMEFHTDPARCCKIRNGPGEAENLPNRSGWIRAADLPKKIGYLKEKFIRKYPAYARTIYPTNPSDYHATVWRSDPNNEDNSDWWDIPWPPYEGMPPFPGSWVSPGMPGDDGAGKKTRKEPWQGRPEHDSAYRYQSDSDSADDLRPDVDDIPELQEQTSNDNSSAGVKRRRTGEAVTTPSQSGVEDTQAEDEGGPATKKAKKSGDRGKPKKTPKRTKKTPGKASSQPSRASSRVRQLKAAADKSRDTSPGDKE